MQAPPVIVVSSACAGLAGLGSSSPLLILHYFLTVVEHKFLFWSLGHFWTMGRMNLVFNVCRWHPTGTGTACFIFIQSSSSFGSATKGTREEQNAKVYNISSVKHTAQLSLLFIFFSLHLFFCQPFSILYVKKWGSWCKYFYLKLSSSKESLSRAKGFLLFWCFRVYSLCPWIILITRIKKAQLRIICALSGDKGFLKNIIIILDLLC